MPHANAQNSIRLRLILIPSTILALGIAAVIGATLYDARGRIASEIRSSLTLGDHLIRYALDDLADAPNSDIAAQDQALLRLREALAHVRHIKIDYVRPEGAERPAPLSLNNAHGAAQRTFLAAPSWLEKLLRSPVIRKTYPVQIGGEPGGELVMTSEPADEIAEIWSSLVFLTALLIAISIAIVALILVTARHTLAPLRQLVEGLDRLGKGEFRTVEDIRIAELSRIGEHFNTLAATLARAEADNHFLIDRLLSIQDAERKELARELHDEFGASLFGIRAAASCIVEACGELGGNEPAGEIVERAKQISALADAIQKQNYRILERIRPVVLRQMGLPDALRQLVSTFAAQNRDCAATIEIAPEAASRAKSFGEDLSLTSYRIVQECLTNAARHAKARNIKVAMALRGEELVLCVEDDGVGLPDDFRQGFGFLGMSERVRKLDGRLNVGGGSKGGARIEAAIALNSRSAGAEDKNRLLAGKDAPADEEKETRESAGHD